jgi:diaminopimelate epimerase
MRITKMHGIGNDYIYVDALNQDLAGLDLPALARSLSDRHFGVGGDGIILVLPSDQADFRMRMFNSDGSEAEMCGNGMRCFAKYVHDHGLTDKTELVVETGAGLIRPSLQITDGTVTTVTVDMGRPVLARERIPMAGSPADQPVVDEPLVVGGEEYRITCVSMGNPHCVLFVDNVSEAPVHAIGPLIENHPAFPARTNVEFVCVAGPALLHMRVWERGSGETLACGTGASASAVAASLTGRAERACTVKLLGGKLDIQWRHDDRVVLTGPAVEVFDAEVDLDSLLRD